MVVKIKKKAVSTDKGVLKRDKQEAPLAGKLMGLLPPALKLSGLQTSPDDEGSDDAPEEVPNLPVEPAAVTGSGEAPTKQVGADVGQKAKQFTRRGPRRKKGADGEAKDDGDADGGEGENHGNEEEYFWQDSASRPLLEQLKEEDDKRRRRRLDEEVPLERDGVVLVPSSRGRALGAGWAPRDAPPAQAAAEPPTSAAPKSGGSRGRRKEAVRSVAPPAVAVTATDFLQDELFNRRKRSRAFGDRHDRNVLGRGANHRLLAR